MNKKDLKKVERIVECMEDIFTICIHNLEHEPYFRVRDNVHEARSHLNSLRNRLYKEIQQIEKDV